MLAGLQTFLGYEGKMFRGFVSVCALFLAAPVLAADRPSAADAIAQKFAGQAEPAPKPQLQKPLAKAEAARPKAQAAQASRSERPTIDYEMDMLRRARAELTSEKTAAQPVATATEPVASSPPAASAAPTAGAAAPVSSPPAPAPLAAAAATVTPPTVPPTAPIAAVSPAVPAVAAAAASTPAPAQNAALTKTAESTPPPAPPAAPAKPDVQAKVDPKPADPAQMPSAASGPDQHATLLLALETSGTSSKSGLASAFDPIICLSDTCFVSAGLNSDAVKLAKLDALKLKSTSDASPDSCKGKVGCVFRNVAVPHGAQIQVIELGSATHDPLHASDAQPDTSCKMSDGGLNCDNPILAADFKIWLVPEETARTAGVQELEDTLADGLPHVDMARATDK
jgi:hypothetical protein